MSSEARLKDWIFEKSSFLELQVIELERPDLLKSSDFDFFASVQIEGRVYKGVGSDGNRDTAIVKAVMEAIERCTITKYHLRNSNGVAAHVDLNQAKKAAADELLERDTFLCHYLTRRSLPEIAQLPDELYRFVIGLKSIGIQTQFFHLATAKADISTYCCAIRGYHHRPNFGYIIGLGTGTSADEGLRKSWTESARSLAHCLGQGGFRSMTLEEFTKLEKVHPEHHLRLSLNKEYAESIEWFFKTGAFECVSRSLIEPHIFFEELVIESLLQSGFPGKIARADSAHLQGLFFGNQKSMDVVNYDRLSAFTGSAFDHKLIPITPHPLG